MIEKQQRFFDQYYPHLNKNEACRYAVNILDALIEEMQNSPLYATSASDEFERAFDDGCLYMIEKLKQAREELYPL